MSNYTKTVNFAAKDALTTGDANKVVKGTEIDTEYNNIETAIATKFDSTNQVVLTSGVSGILPVANGGTGSASGAPAAIVQAGTFSTGGYTFNSGSTVAFGAPNPFPALHRVYIEAITGNPALVASRGNGTFANCILCDDLLVSSSTTRPFITFSNNNVGMAAITTTDGATVQYGTGSDYRLKTNVIPLTGSAAKVKALKPCSYNWIKAPEVLSQGFLAHELAEVVPQAVIGKKDALYPDGKINIQQVDLSYVVPLLTSALQEALARIEALEAK